MNSLVLCVVTLATLSNYVQCPSSFKKCDKRRSDFNQCLSEVIYNSLKKFDKPQQSHGLPNLYHLKFPPDVVIEIGNRTYGLLQKYNKFRIVGITKPESVTARLDFEPVISTLTVEAFFPQLILQMECEAQGTILFLPLNVVTPVDFIADNPTFTLTIKLEEYDKGDTHFRVIDSNLDVQTEAFRFDFKKLFSNKRLNDEFNSAMNEKGLQIFHIHKPLQAHFAPHFDSLFSSFMEKVPAAALFVE
ncbi:hypothetical protein Zmor_018822 [Zophobas morio]|uniref:Protein takeout n=1 Tax=Zophobas morio TaxID=2755281 RepID=A0AA38ID36_9CUCU|nr:hypothetical protein Zmor_018822 [Zophobas morio]